jgi:ParB/RepB/Spo0J family partition protein
MKKIYHHEVKLVKLTEIRLNKYNPNVVSEEIMEQLTKRIEEEGFLQPVLLRNIEPEGEIKYEVIDGEHRFLAAQKLGYEDIPSIVIDKKLPEAMLSTINMNKLRGEFDTLKLAEVIHELNKTYTIEELEEKLGYSNDELQGLENLLKFDYEDFKEENDALDELGEAKEYRFEVVLTQEQYDTINKALELTKLEENSEGISLICKEYIKNHG